MKVVRIPHPKLAELKAEIVDIASYAKRYLWPARLDAEANLMAVWDGQSSDGRKHEEDIGEEPYPFEGATDMRVRLADQLRNEEAQLLVVSALRAQLYVKGVESSDRKRALRMSLLMQWVLRNALGVSWVRELVRLANFYTGDSPGVAMMRCWWEREEALGLEKVDGNRLMELLTARVAEDSGEDARVVLEAMRPDLELLVSLAGSKDPDPGAALMLTGVLQRLFPGLSEARAVKAGRELVGKGLAEFPVRFVRRNGPAVSTLRHMEDWWIRVNARTFERAGMWFEVEWLTESELRARVARDGYAAEFVKLVCGEVSEKGERSGGFEGVAAFPEYVRRMESRRITERDRQFYKGLFQVVTVFYRATDEDGVPGLFYQVLHNACEVQPHGPRLVGDGGGEWPAVVFQREVIGTRLLDSRGVAEIAGPYQGLLKLFVDSHGDHAQIAGVPPILTHGRRQMGQLKIGPLEEIPLRRDGDVKWMQPPQYPATITNFVAEMRRQIDEYFGRPNAELSPELVQTSRMFKVAWFLAQLREVLKRLMVLCQEHMGEEELARITNAQGERLIFSREEIAGEFDLGLVFDPQDLNPEALERTATIVKDLLLAMDREKTISTAPVVASLFYRLAPDIADASIVDVDTAQGNEIEDEVRAYQQIRAGIEPDLPDDGSVNYELRRNVYAQMEQVNPQVFADLAEDKRAILQSRLERMGVLAQQYGANVEIGREGGKRALGQ